MQSLDGRKEEIMIWKLTQNKDWPTLEKQFSWVEDMKHVPQRRDYHAEGNVAVHTQMVIRKLEKLSQYQALGEQDKEILWAAALMHDIEKRSTTVDEGGGKYSANNHARKGEFTTRTILYRDIPTPFHIREQICSLVRLHGLPLWLLDKGNPEKKVVEAAFRVNMQHLKILAEADARGRICEDFESLTESLEFFEIFCKEKQCWDHPYKFETSAARFHYFNTDDSYIGYVPFEEFKCNVTLLCGLPGVGKDYYIQSLKKYIPVVSLDNIRRKYKISPIDKSGNGWVVQTAKEEAREYLRRGQDFVWNATNITRQMRKLLIDLFISYKARVEIVYIEKPYDVWRRQNINREYVLPEKVLDNMLGKLEIPQITEAHEVKYHF